MAFAKGQSGNPAGKPKGTVSKITQLRRSLEKDLPDVLAALVDQAKSGDTQAIKILLDRVMPALKPTDQPVALPLGGVDLGGDGRAVLAAVGAGEATPEQATKILQGLGALARVVEVAELIGRVEALEQAHVATKN